MHDVHLEDSFILAEESGAELFPACEVGEGKCLESLGVSYGNEVSLANLGHDRDVGGEVEVYLKETNS